MKQKTHSGTKKRIEVRKSGLLMAQKSCRNHLLSNKSKRQKKMYKSGMPVTKTQLRTVKKLVNN